MNPKYRIDVIHTPTQCHLNICRDNLEGAQVAARDWARIELSIGRSIHPVIIRRVR
jgi:hypothetical protein